MNVNELRIIAKEHAIENYNSLAKSELIEKLKEVGANAGIIGVSEAGAAVVK